MLGVRVACCLVLVFFGSVALARTPVVLIIESYHPVLAWTAQCEEGIRQALGEGFDVRSFFMDTKRIPESDFALSASRAWEAVQSIEPDLVMLGDDDALSMLGPRVAQTDIPIVYFGINNNPRNYFTQLPRNMAGVLERTPVTPWLRHLAEIMPLARRVLVLLDNSLTSDSIVDLVFQGRASIHVGKLGVEFHVASDWADWQDRIRGASAYDFVLTPTFHALRGSEGYIDIPVVVSWTSSNSPVPVFSNQEYTIGDDGFTGALVLVGTEHGRLAGEIARGILEGTFSPRNAPLLTDRAGQFYFSRKQLDRFGILLPEDIRRNALLLD